MKLKLLAIVPVVSAIVLLNGCGGAKPTPAQTKAQTASKFAIGKATKDDVIAALGNPTAVSATSTGEELLVYNTSHITGKSFIPFYYGNDHVRMTSSTYKFKNNILTDYSQSSSHY